MLIRTPCWAAGVLVVMVGDDARFGSAHVGATADASFGPSFARTAKDVLVGRPGVGPFFLTTGTCSTYTYTITERGRIVRANLIAYTSV